jgi:cytochrome P450
MTTGGVMELAGVEWRSAAGYIVALVAVVVVCLVKVVGGRRSAKLPPGPKALPLIGNLHQVSELSHQALWDMAKQYGPIMYLQMGANPLVVVSSADAAQEFIKVQDKAWSGRPTTIAGKIFSNNYRNIVHAPNGPHWRHMRKICTTELFTPKRLETFRAPRTEEFSQMVQSIYQDSLSGDPIMLTVKLGHLATNNITRMLLGKRQAPSSQIPTLQSNILPSFHQ